MTNTYIKVVLDGYINDITVQESKKIGYEIKQLLTQKFGLNVKHVYMPIQK